MLLGLVHAKKVEGGELLARHTCNPVFMFKHTRQAKKKSFELWRTQSEPSAREASLVPYASPFPFEITPREMLPFSPIVNWDFCPDCKTFDYKSNLWCPRINCQHKFRALGIFIQFSVRKNGTPSSLAMKPKKPHEMICAGDLSPNYLSSGDPSPIYLSTAGPSKPVLLANTFAGDFSPNYSEHTFACPVSTTSKT